MKPQRVACLLCLLQFVFALMVGCGREYGDDQRFPLSGNVTYDGKAIDMGTISFLPLSGDKQRVSGGLIENGAYNVPEEQGANQGKYRVEIRWAKKTGKQFLDADTQTMVDRRDEGLPPRFHKDSSLTAEVSADNTKFDFDLKSQ